MVYGYLKNELEEDQTTNAPTTATTTLPTLSPSVAQQVSVMITLSVPTSIIWDSSLSDPLSMAYETSSRRILDLFRNPMEETTQLVDSTAGIFDVQFVTGDNGRRGICN